MTMDKLKELLGRVIEWPWRVRNGSEIVSKDVDGSPWVVADMASQCGYKEDTAPNNATLIALAPQLAAALIEAIEGLDNLSRLGNGDKPGNSDGNVMARATLSSIDAIMEGKG